MYGLQALHFTVDIKHTAKCLCVQGAELGLNAAFCFTVWRMSGQNAYCKAFSYSVS